MAKRKRAAIFEALDRRSLKVAAYRDHDVPSYLTVSQFFQMIARSLLALEDRLMKLETRLEKSN